MAKAGRLGDKSLCKRDVHGCTACSHAVIGPGVQGAGNVTVNRKPALRKGDMGIHMACCALNQWQAQGGSTTVFINGQPAFRQGDATKHCGGRGELIQGSGDVTIGNSQTAALKRAAASHKPCVAL